MLRRTRTIVALAAMAALTVGGAAYASDGPQHHGWFGFGGGHHPHFHHGHGFFAGHVTAGTVTAVGDGSLTLKTHDGTSVTIKTDAGTKVYATGKPGSLSDLKTGWLAFVVKGSNGVADIVRAASEATVKQAIKDHQAQVHDWQTSHHFAAGKITAVGSDSLTLVGGDGTSVTVKVNSDTKVFDGHKPIALSSLTTGWLTFASEGDDDVADVIRAASPAELHQDMQRHHHEFHHSLHGQHVAAGKITAVGDTTLTLTGHDGKTVTVKIDSNTQVFSGHDHAKLSDLKKGWFAFAVEGKNGVAVFVRAADLPTFSGHHGDDGHGSDRDKGGSDDGSGPSDPASGTA